MSRPDISLRDAALALAHAGYLVIPLRARTKMRRCHKGTQPSNDRAVVREWWRRMPDANIGVVLNDLWAVVIDVDGPEGRASLAWLLAQAGMDHLPDTYTVTTGRLDGGEHLWYRLPPDAVKLVSQYGQHNPTTPHLDILFQGLAVGAGSIHESGAIYRGSVLDVPEISALAELPMGFYEVLAHRGRPKVAEVASAPRRRRAAPVRTGSGTGDLVAQILLPRHVQNWLADSTDGRNGRTYRTVLALVRLGLDDQYIISTVLASPLGSKALQQVNPYAWVQDKVDDARDYIPVVLDHEAFWQAVHTSGMSPGQVRLLDTLLGRASMGGYVSMSQDWMAIDSAVAKTSGAVHTLIAKGWLSVVETWTFDRPASYRLAIPDVGSDEKYPPQVCPPSPSPLFQYGRWGRFLVSHDAFRCKQGSLHSAYPLLTLLRAEPQSMDNLAGWLRVTHRALRDRAKLLITAGVAVQSEGGLALTGDPLLPLLDAVGVRVGTDGARDLAIKVYFAKVAERQRFLAEAGEVGSPTWRKYCHARMMARLDQGDLAALVEHLGGDVQAAAIYMVEQEVLMLSPDPETKAKGLAMLAADPHGSDQ